MASIKQNDLGRVLPECYLQQVVLYEACVMKNMGYRKY